jgi:hypothetical protein
MDRRRTPGSKRLSDPFSNSSVSVSSARFDRRSITDDGGTDAGNLLRLWEEREPGRYYGFRTRMPGAVDAVFDYRRNGRPGSSPTAAPVAVLTPTLAPTSSLPGATITTGTAASAEVDERRSTIHCRSTRSTKFNGSLR